MQIGRAHVRTPVPPISPLFPYTTLFRSHRHGGLLRKGRQWPSNRTSRDQLDEFPTFHAPPRCRSEEHTSELQSHRYLHSFPTRRSSDLTGRAAFCARAGNGQATALPEISWMNSRRFMRRPDADRKSTRPNSSPTDISTLSLHDALPISQAGRPFAQGPAMAKQPHFPRSVG